METIRLTGDVHIEEPTAVSLGKFDGFHLGHQLLMERILDKKKEGLKSVIFTFDFGGRPELLTEDEKIRFLSGRGIDYLVICPFIENLIHMEAADFIKRILIESLNMRYAAVGTDFRFGYRRGGDPALLLEAGERLGFAVDVVEKAKLDGEDISSSRVREELLKGNIEMVNRLLGYAWSLSGVVKHGRMLGRRLGMPTINIVPPADKLLPPRGVYATRTRIAGENFGGITNIGIKPTVSDENAPVVETYLFDLDQDLYGEELTVRFYGYERPEQRFESVEALKSRIEKDVVWGRNFLEGPGLC